MIMSKVIGFIKGLISAQHLCTRDQFQSNEAHLSAGTNISSVLL